jgi:hypothetical protein
MNTHDKDSTVITDITSETVDVKGRLDSSPKYASFGKISLLVQFSRILLR